MAATPKLPLKNECSSPRSLTRDGGCGPADPNPARNGFTVFWGIAPGDAENLNSVSNIGRSYRDLKNMAKWASLFVLITHFT
jgi:hypothetical protein